MGRTAAAAFRPKYLHTPTTQTKDVPSPRPLWIVGVCGTFHDSAAVLLKDGVVHGALEEERITRAKHDGSPFPVHAVLRLLEQAGLSWSDIHHVAFAWNYSLYEQDGSGLPSGVEFFADLHQRFAEQNGIDVAEVQRRDVFERNKVRYSSKTVREFLELMSEATGIHRAPPVTYVRHHWAHAASTYYASGFNEPTLVLTIDGYGDTETTTVWLGRDRTLSLIETIPIPHSLGWMYAAVTEYLGFKPLCGEGEVMGLAPYGLGRTPSEHRLSEQLDAIMCEFIQLRPQGVFEVNPEFVYFGKFSQGYTRVTDHLLQRLRPLVPARTLQSTRLDPKSEVNRPHALLARAAQKRLEETIVHLARHYVTIHPQTRGVNFVALAGGVAYNINANRRLITEGLVSPERIFIPPAAGDAGAALGAAMIVAQQIYGVDPSCRMRRVDLGPRYDDRDIRTALTAAGLAEGRDYEVQADDSALVSRVAALLAKNCAIGWFQGGSEFGPRALGFRSILLNPADPKASEKANLAKRREYWRPSAISLPADMAHAYLERLDTAEAPFMNLSFDVRPPFSEKILSGRHFADGSTRPQTVSKDQNPLFWQLLHRFGKLTGLAAVVNTSLNRDEPLVESPEEALNTYSCMSEIDFLAIGHFLITSRSNVRPSVISMVESESKLPKAASLFRAQRTVGDEIEYLTCEARQQCHKIVVSLGTGMQSHSLVWPLVREFFDARGGRDLRRLLGAEIVKDVNRYGTDNIAIGCTGEKYDYVVFLALRQVVRAAMTASGVKRGRIVTFSRLGQSDKRTNSLKSKSAAA